MNASDSGEKSHRTDKSDKPSRRNGKRGTSIRLRPRKYTHISEVLNANHR